MYAEILALIARAIAKNHGFILSDDADILRMPSARALLYTSDAEAALEVINGYLMENEIEFADLEVENGYIMPSAVPIETAPAASKLDWAMVDQLVRNMYGVWGVKRADRATFDQYESDRVDAIEDHYNHAQLIEIYQNLYKTALNPYSAPLNHKSKLCKAIFEMLNPYKGWLNVKLYFDADYKCIGGEASDRWAIYYQTSDRKIHYEREILIKAGYNPLNRPLAEVLQDSYQEPAPEPAKKQETKPAPEPARNDPKNTAAEPMPKLPIDFFRSCNAAQKKLYFASFVGREKAFKEFLVVKAELNALTASNIKIGKMTASESTAKSWNITGGENGEDKAALFWDTNGWSIGPRTVDGELTGVFEDWDLSLHLSENDAYANGLHASQWYDATDEVAEAEAIAAQQQEAAAK